MRILVDMTSVSSQTVKTLTQHFSETHVNHSHELVLFGDSQIIKSNLGADQRNYTIVESESVNAVIQALQEAQNQALLTFGDSKYFYSLLDNQQDNKFAIAHATLFKKDDKPIMLLDSGVNTEPNANTLFYFAYLANIYMQNILNTPTPCVGILSNGEEEGKGTQLIRDIGELLQDSTLNYMGNIEPAEIIAGDADLIITDGYTGDIFLKTFVPAMRYLLKLIRDERSSNVLTQIGEYVANAGLTRTDQKINDFQNLGGPILGYNNLAFWCPPNADLHIIQNALNTLQRSADADFIKLTKEISVL